MATAQDAIKNLQTQALDAIKTGQDAAVEAIQAMRRTLANITPAPMRSVGDLIPDVGDTVGDPKAIVDSVYDFAAQLLKLNQEFVHRLLEASESASITPIKKAPRKTTTAAK